MYGYQFCIEPTEDIRMLSKSNNLAEMHTFVGCKNMYTLLPFNFICVPKPSNFELKSLGLKTFETIAIARRLLPILLTLQFSY